MKVYQCLRGLLLAFLGASLSLSVQAESLESFFDNGSVSGNIRAFYNTREFDLKPDESAFSLGSALRAETGALGALSFGLGFYTAQDLNTNDDDPAKVNRRLGSDLEVIGEAYLKLSNEEHTAKVGRQRIETPFANSGDSFMIPFAFEAFSYQYQGSEKVSVVVNLINSIKNRNSDEFVDVGLWSSNRFGIPDSRTTSGTVTIGAKYKGSRFKLEGWGSRYSEFYDQIYLRGDYLFKGGDMLTPFVSVQYGMQQDSGDSLVGEVDSSIYGVQAGTSMGRFKITLGFNEVPDQSDSFRNGAFLSPYTFSTSPLFTNNMVETFENVDSGSAGKVTVNFNPSDQIALKLSFASLNFDQVVDRDALDADVTYRFSKSLKGLSLRWRLEVVSSDSDNVDLINMRFQTQYTF